MTNIRDFVLSKCQDDKMFVVVFTTNGFQLKGTIRSFDDDVVMIDQNDGKQAMVYKHAISTIVPQRNVI